MKWWTIFAAVIIVGYFALMGLLTFIALKS